MQTLVLTGGSSGIGLATATLFAARGWRVIELSRHGLNHDGIDHVDCDVTDETSVGTAMDEVMQRTDHIDVLISNAGFGISGAVEYTTMADARRQMDVNFYGTLHIVRAVLPIMRSQGQGRIVMTSSVAAVLPVPYQSMYSASKAAINALALALSNEVRSWGIQVSVLMPGDVSTGFTRARDKSEAGSEVYTNIHSAVSTMEKDELGGMKPEQMAQCMWRIVHHRYQAPQYIGGGQYAVLCFLDRLLPKRLVNWIEYKLYC